MMLRTALSFGMLLCAGTAAANPSIDVYPNGSGIVSRTDPVQGATTVRIPVPAHFDVRQVRVTPSGKAAVLGTRLERGPVASGVPEDQKALQDQIEDLQRQLRGNALAREAVQSSRAFLTQAQWSAQQSGPGLAETYAVHSAQLRALATEQAGLENAQKELDQALMEAQASLARLSSPALEAFLLIQASGTGSLTTSYPVRGVHARLSYQGHADTEQGRLRLEPSLELQQQTGLPWTGMRVRYLTRPPERRLQIPELPRPVVRNGPVAPVAVAAKAVRREAMAGMAEAEEADRFLAASPPVAAIEASGLSLTITFDAPIDLESGANRIVLTAPVIEGPIALKSVIAPEVSDAVFLLGELAFNQPIPQGQTDWFVDGAYVGASSIAERAAAETWSVGLGVDPRFRALVDHKPRQASTGFFGRHQQWEVSTALALSNLSDAAGQVWVRSSIPRSTEESISVTRVGIPDSAQVLDGVDQWLSWPVRLPAKGESSIRYGYTVKAPADYQLHW